MNTYLFSNIFYVNLHFKNLVNNSSYHHITDSNCLIQIGKDIQSGNLADCFHDININLTFIFGHFLKFDCYYHLNLEGRS